MGQPPLLNTHSLHYLNKPKLKNSDRVADYQRLTLLFCLLWDASDLFLYKSRKWEYENEYRLFNKPGNHSFASNDLELSAILYTPWMPKRDKEQLQIIKDLAYEPSLEIKEIFPRLSGKPKEEGGSNSICPSVFHAYKKDNQGTVEVHDWIKKDFDSL